MQTALVSWPEEIKAIHRALTPKHVWAGGDVCKTCGLRKKSVLRWGQHRPWTQYFRDGAVAAWTPGPCPQP